MTVWNVQHTTSSPRYSRSIGLAESMEKKVKKRIKKCVHSEQDIYMGLLILRNSPLICGSCPTQLLMNRKLQDNLPKFHMSRPLKPQRDLLKERIRSKERHYVKLPNQKVFEKFQSRNEVVVQDPKSKEWSLRRKMLKQIAPRSFEVKVDEKKY